MSMFGMISKRQPSSFTSFNRLRENLRNYNVALYILRDHYENASKQTNVLMQKFHTMPTPKHNPKDLHVFLTEYRKIKHQLSHVLDFRQSELVIKSIVVRKLPFQTFDRICDIM